jgi:hypothetical protein
MSYARQRRTKRRQRTCDRDMVLAASRTLEVGSLYTCLFCVTASSSSSSSASHVFRRPCDLALHLSRAHADHPGAVRCAQLLSPRGAARDTKPFPCPHPSCASGYTDMSELRYHLRRIHGHGSLPSSLAATEESLDDAATASSPVVVMDDDEDENENGSSPGAADCPMLYLDDNLTSWSFDAEAPTPPTTTPLTPVTPQTPMPMGDLFADDDNVSPGEWLDMGMDFI